MCASSQQDVHFSWCPTPPEYSVVIHFCFSRRLHPDTWKRLTKHVCEILKSLFFSLCCEPDSRLNTACSSYSHILPTAAPLTTEPKSIFSQMLSGRHVFSATFRSPYPECLFRNQDRLMSSKSAVIIEKRVRWCCAGTTTLQTACCCIIYIFLICYVTYSGKNFMSERPRALIMQLHLTVYLNILPNATAVSLMSRA